VVGVNNRNLRTLQVDVEASARLARHIPSDIVAVSESGLQSRADLEQLMVQGYRAFLIGERFMTDPDPARAISELISPVARTVQVRADKPERLAPRE
jgi:indole-3-glycerol phosphate synthase